MSVILGEHFDKFIQGEIKSGRYTSASEVLRSGLRLLEIEKEKINSINKALTQGENSGKAVAFSNDKFKQRMRKKFKLNA